LWPQYEGGGRDARGSAPSLCSPPPNPPYQCYRVSACQSPLSPRNYCHPSRAVPRSRRRVPSTRVAGRIDNDTRGRRSTPRQRRQSCDFFNRAHCFLISVRGAPLAPEALVRLRAPNGMHSPMQQPMPCAFPPQRASRAPPINVPSPSTRPLHVPFPFTLPPHVPSPSAFFSTFANGPQ
jgi:hypothetical protein